ncbi:MAG: carbon storage regulator [Planctomycetaceae bacterium]|nr:carbon storage regulator [Planctomycetales bacterium]MCB9925201.1 carbon storage regulator [Planctomycetaceae bacterium]
MLILSRKIGEEIVISDQVRVRVAGIQGNRVKLAVSAPEQVAILRGEIQGQRHEFNLEPESLALVGVCE